MKELEDIIRLQIAIMSKASCPQCHRIILWSVYSNLCNICDCERLENDFSNWTSDNQQVDEFIKELQLRVADYQGNVVEWIPYARFENITPIGKGSFAEVFKADWLDGQIKKWNYDVKQWERVGKMCVALKVIGSSKDEFLNEVNE